MIPPSQLIWWCPPCRHDIGKVGGRGGILAGIIDNNLFLSGSISLLMSRRYIVLVRRAHCIGGVADANIES